MESVLEKLKWELWVAENSLEEGTDKYKRLQSKREIQRLEDKLYRDYGEIRTIHYNQKLQYGYSKEDNRAY